MNYLVWGFVDLGICKPETKHFGRHVFRDFCPEKLLKHEGFDLPLELFEPEIEFPLSIFTLIQFFFWLCCVIAQKGFEAVGAEVVGSWDLSLGFGLLHGSGAPAWSIRARCERDPGCIPLLEIGQRNDNNRHSLVQLCRRLGWHGLVCTRCGNRRRNPRTRCVRIFEGPYWDGTGKRATSRSLDGAHLAPTTTTAATAGRSGVATGVLWGDGTLGYSGNGVFCTFWLRNVLRATTACKFWSLICPAGSAPAALASLLFRPSGVPKRWKTQCVATFRPFRAPASSFFWPCFSSYFFPLIFFPLCSLFFLLCFLFFLLSSLFFFFVCFCSLVFSSVLFSSHVFSDSSHLGFSICPYCRKLDFQTSLDDVEVLYCWHSVMFR